MNILVTTPYFHPHPGGSQRYIEELYSQVHQLDASIRTDVLTYNTEKVKKRETYRGMTVYRLDCIEILRGQFALPNYLELRSLISELKSKNYQIVNAHTRFFDNSWWSPWLAKNLGAKALLTDHTASHPAHNSALVRFVSKTVDRLVIPYLDNHYEHVTVVSQATRDFLYKLGMKQPIEVTYCGVDTLQFQKTKARSQLLFGHKISQDDVVISFVGRMIPAKGPNRLLDAVKPLLRQYPQVQVFFAGDGELLKDVNRFKSNQIHVLGRITSEQVTQLLSRTDIFVHPSTHHEGLPIAILEAGAAGCAVIATDNGATTEVISHGKSGLIVAPRPEAISEALVGLIENTKTREEYGHNLQTKIDKTFTWQVIAQKYVSYIKTMKEGLHD